MGARETLNRRVQRRQALLEGCPLLWDQRNALFARSFLSVLLIHLSDVHHGFAIVDVDAHDPPAEAQPSQVATRVLGSIHALLSVPVTPFPPRLLGAHFVKRRASPGVEDRARSTHPGRRLAFN